MPNFAYDIGDQIGEFEVVSRSELAHNGELQYTIISKAHADARRKEQADREAEIARAEEASRQIAESEAAAAANTEIPAPAEVTAPAVASEEPETLQPKS